jgi:hypothetical protein
VLTKRCPSCEDELPRSAFGRNKALPDGLSFYCLACNRARNRAWYRSRRESQGKGVRDHSWVPDGFRWCPACQQAVAHEGYTRNSRTASGFGSMCASCKATADRAGYFYRRYGLTQTDVVELRAAQSDRCAICGDAGPQHLDHDHETGAVRKLLCQRCNHGLGLFRDDPALLRAAAEYVEGHRARGASAGSLLEPGALPGAPPRRQRHGAARSRPSPGYARWLAMHPARSNG